MILFQWKLPPGFPFSPRREALIAMRALGIDVIAMLETPQLIFGEPLELRSVADGVFDSWRNGKSMGKYHDDIPWYSCMTLNISHFSGNGSSNAYQPRCFRCLDEDNPWEYHGNVVYSKTQHRWKSGNHVFFLLMEDIMGILYGKYDVMDGDIFYHVYWELIIISIIRFSHQDHGFLFLDEDFMGIVYIQYDDMSIYIYIYIY